MAVLVLYLLLPCSNFGTLPSSGILLWFWLPAPILIRYVSPGNPGSPR